jgi:hypothetical protein
MTTAIGARAVHAMPTGQHAPLHTEVSGIENASHQTDSIQCLPANTGVALRGPASAALTSARSYNRAPVTGKAEHVRMECPWPDRVPGEPQKEARHVPVANGKYGDKLAATAIHNLAQAPIIDKGVGMLPNITKPSHALHAV